MCWHLPVGVPLGEPEPHAASLSHGPALHPPPRAWQPGDAVRAGGEQARLGDAAASVSGLCRLRKPRGRAVDGDSLAAAPGDSGGVHAVVSVVGLRGRSPFDLSYPWGSGGLPSPSPLSSTKNSPCPGRGGWAAQRVSGGPGLGRRSRSPEPALRRLRSSRIQRAGKKCGALPSSGVIRYLRLG